MSAYILAQVSISDRGAYAAYEAGFRAILDNHRGEIVSVDESPEVLEGDWPCTRTVLLRFVSKEAARGWYHSEAYKQLAQVRFNSASANIVMVAGFD